MLSDRWSVRAPESSYSLTSESPSFIKETVERLSGTKLGQVEKYLDRPVDTVVREVSGQVHQNYTFVISISVTL